jgi:hypothetical protein
VCAVLMQLGDQAALALHLGDDPENVSEIAFRFTTASRVLSRSSAVGPAMMLAERVGNKSRKLWD